MRTAILLQASLATLEGKLPFPEIVALLLQEGVASYHVDYLRHRFTYYDEGDGSCSVPLGLDALPPVAAIFDRDALRAAILDSQQHGQPFPRFCERATRAGVQGYFAYLLGGRVTYYGRLGELHTEWFPGRSPDEDKR